MRSQASSGIFLHPATLGSRVAVISLGSWLLFSGCSSTVLYQRDAASTPNPHDGVSVVFAATPALPSQASVGRDIVWYVSDALRSDFPTLRLVSEEEFIRTAFPGLPPDAAPLSNESLRTSPQLGELREQVSALAVRYLIVVDGGTVQRDRSGGGYCGAWYRGGGCFGFWIWRRESVLSASLYDLQQAVSVGSVRVTVRGRPWVTVIAVVPVGLPAFTESWACGKLGAGVVKLLRGTDGR